MHLSENALVVLEKRYFAKNAAGECIEDWPAMINRVARNISGGDEALFEKYYALLDSGHFLPKSPTLMNAGGELQQLSAC
ncbi:MAG: ribonucleotide reductase N-terminal alpha domain-containing protein, partial [Spirochaetia bacterium]|nr:ribonucleotide reductase N-terminal alpha domain-containing protein [Spirochaetia bacterium]